MQTGLDAVIVGVDVGAPRRARDQRRKIVAVAAYPAGERAYRVDTSGINARLLAGRAPGWSAQELVDELLARPVRVVGFDFPFCVPDALLQDAGFAASVGHVGGAFGGWRSFSAWVARRLPLSDPLDFAPFAPWRDPAQRARLWTPRATDVAAGGQPPLKDLFQATFQMTLLGNAVLAQLWESGLYRVLPFPGGEAVGEVIEVYPGATLRAFGLASYKARPWEAMALCVGACARAGIALDVAPELLEVASRYSSGTRRSPDHDIADAFVALCTAILYAEGCCRPMGGPGGARWESHVAEREGAIWVPVAPAARTSQP